MELHSGRLAFLPYTRADLDRYLALVTDPQVMQYIAGRSLTEEEGAQRFEKALAFHAEDPETGNFMVFTRQDGQYIGLAKLVVTAEREAEIGYALLPAFWGKGYAREIVRFFIDYARRLDRFDRLIATVAPENLVSIRILTGFGFKPYREGTVGDLPVVYYELPL